MHLCTAKIMLAGDSGQIVWRQADNPVSWPEIGVIQMAHGEDAVFDIEVVAEIEATRYGEKQRLVEIYGRDLLELVYPGRAPALEMTMPGVNSIPKPKKQRPVRTVAPQPNLGRFSGNIKAPDPIPAGEPYKDEVETQSGTV